MALPKLSVPQYEVKLPSTGEVLSLRPYLVKEEKVLMIALESSDPVQISNAVRNVIQACYDLKDLKHLTVFDIEYLFLQLRGKSVGEEMELRIKCTHCEELNPFVVSVDEIKVKNEKPDNIIMLTEDVGVEMRYPSVDTFAALDIEKLNSVEGVMDLIIECVDKVFDADNVYGEGDMTKKELVEFIENLNSDQFKKVQSFFNSIPAIEYKGDFKCEHCGEHNDVELKGLQSFFS